MKIYRVWFAGQWPEEFEELHGMSLKAAVYEALRSYSGTGHAKAQWAQVECLDDGEWVPAGIEWVDLDELPAISAGDLWIEDAERDWWDSHSDWWDLAVASLGLVWEPEASGYATPCGEYMPIGTVRRFANAMRHGPPPEHVAREIQAWTTPQRGAGRPAS